MASLTNPATEEAQPYNVENLKEKLREALIYAEQMGVQSETMEGKIQELKKKQENLRAQLQQANSVTDNLKIIIQALEEDMLIQKNLRSLSLVQKLNYLRAILILLYLIKRLKDFNQIHLLELGSYLQMLVLNQLRGLNLI